MKEYRLAHYRRPITKRHSLDWATVRRWFPLMLIIAVLLAAPITAAVTARIIPAYTNIFTRAQLGADQLITRARITDRVEVWDADESGVTYYLNWEFDVMLPDGALRTFEGAQHFSSYQGPLPEIGEFTTIVYNPENPTVSMIYETVRVPVMDWVWAFIGFCLLVVALLAVAGLLLAWRYDVERLMLDLQENPPALRQLLRR
jgi:hypothetical protein